MSDFFAPSPGNTKAKACHKPLWRWWHALCSVACAGCFYPMPAWEAMNRPPTIDSPRNHHLLQPLVVDRPSVPVWVVARDQDDDALSFLWFVDEAPATNVTTTADGDAYVSSAVIDQASVLAGSEVRCIVSDGAFEDDIEILWEVDVP